MLKDYVSFMERRRRAAQAGKPLIYDYEGGLTDKLRGQIGHILLQALGRESNTFWPVIEEYVAEEMGVPDLGYQSHIENVQRFLRDSDFDPCMLLIEYAFSGASGNCSVYPRRESGGARRPRPLVLRPLTDGERTTIARLAHSRTEPARTVERARMVWRAHHGERVPTIARVLGVKADTVRHWLARFTVDGVAGLADARRTGRPPTYSPEQVGLVIATSLTRPDDLGLPFGYWTLDRLTTCLHENHALPISRSRIGELLHEEGLRWRQEETWFGARVDPAFSQKRGPSSPSTRTRPPVAS